MSLTLLISQLTINLCYGQHALAMVLAVMLSATVQVLATIIFHCHYCMELFTWACNTGLVCDLYRKYMAARARLYEPHLARWDDGCLQSVRQQDGNSCGAFVLLVRWQWLLSQFNCVSADILETVQDRAFVDTHTRMSSGQAFEAIKVMKAYWVACFFGLTVYIVVGRFVLSMQLMEGVCVSNVCSVVSTDCRWQPVNIH